MSEQDTTNITPEGDDVEGHGVTSKHIDSPDTDVEGHGARFTGLDSDEDDVAGHAISGRIDGPDKDDVEPTLPAARPSWRTTRTTSRGTPLARGTSPSPTRTTSRATPPRRSTETSRSRPCGVDSHGRLRVTSDRSAGGALVCGGIRARAPVS